MEQVEAVEMRTLVVCGLAVIMMIVLTMEG